MKACASLVAEEGSNRQGTALQLIFYCDKKRHLVCAPYSITNLHHMADVLGIKRCWFHKNHYDIPKTRQEETMSRCVIVSTRTILSIIHNESI
jgi:hypothetical protein